MEIQWPDKGPKQQKRKALIETCYNRLFNFVWRNWTLDRWTSFPLDSCLSNRVVVRKWSRIHKVKQWTASHTVGSTHLTPRLRRQVVWRAMGTPTPQMVTQRTDQPLGLGPLDFGSLLKLRAQFPFPCCTLSLKPFHCAQWMNILLKCIGN